MKEKIGSRHQKFLCFKGQHQESEKTTYRMGGGICKSYIYRGLIYKDKKISYNSIIKKQKNPIKQWAKDLNRHFSKEDI